METPTSQIFVGVDFARYAHDVIVLDAAGNELLRAVVEHTGADLKALVDALVNQTGDATHIHVAIETPHGAVVDTFIDRGCAVFAINPKQLDRFRDRFSAAGAKDDVRDATVLASTLRTDRHAFRQIEPISPVVVEMRGAYRAFEAAQQDIVGLTNRAQAILAAYYPAFLAVESDMTLPWVLELWTLAPTPQQGRTLDVEAVDALLKRRRIRRLTGEQIVAILSQNPLTLADGIVEGATFQLGQAVAQLRLLVEHRDVARKRVETLVGRLKAEQAAEIDEGSPTDVEILSSFDGMGPLILAVLYIEASHLIDRRRLDVIRCLGGAAPVTHQTGKRRDRGGNISSRPGKVSMRRACSKRLANALFHLGRVAAIYDEVEKRRYARCRRRGHRHARACRQIADRLLLVMGAALESRTLYDPARRTIAAAALAV